MLILLEGKGTPKRGLLVGAFLFLLVFLPGAQSPHQPVAADYRQLHFRSTVADAHNDVVQRILNGEDIGKRTSAGHSDIPRFLEGGVDIQMFSIWVPPDKKHKSYFDQANEQIDSIYSLASRNSSLMGIARNEAEISKLLAQKRFVAMFGMEGGHPLDDDVKKVDHFYNRGVRYITLTWNNSTTWASSAYDETVQPEKLKHKGLSNLGRVIVRRMNELGIMVDISHVGEKTFWDVVETTTRPLIASHSSVWKLCRHRRNLKDDQLKAIAKSGGVVFINFLPNFIDSTFAAKEQRLRERNKSRIDSLRKAWKSDWLSFEDAVVEMLKEEYRAIRPPLTTLIDHFEYVINLVGIDHVGLGSDFDGIHSTPIEMDDVTFLPNITRELLSRGYSPEEVQKVLGGNFMRVVQKVCR